MGRPKLWEDTTASCLNIRKAVKEHAQENNINLSEWINTEYTEKFLSTNSKIKRIDELQGEIVKLREEIKASEERAEFYRKSLTERELHYIAQVKSRQREGKHIESMKTYFNNEFKRNFSLDEFIGLVRLYEEDLEKRFLFAIKKNKEEKRHVRN